MFSFPTIKHDTDGKIYYEGNNGRVIWITEVPDYVQDSVAKAFNQTVKQSVNLCTEKIHEEISSEISTLLLMAQYYVTPEGIGIDGSIKILDRLKEIERKYKKS